ncbi:MAG TPA: sigma-70 family RNA polymerase sigma factor [Gammaproteobacteria bacterium]|nr:sigma-70 family RNA polymerase sigma factor [Gammaproteobacteria bacterium]
MPNPKEYRKQMRKWIRRQLTIVRLRDEKGMKLRQIGEKYGISAQRVARLYEKGKARKVLDK